MANKLFEKTLKEILSTIRSTDTATPMQSSSDPEVQRAQGQLQQVTIKSKEKELNALKQQPRI